MSGSQKIKTINDVESAWIERKQAIGLSTPPPLELIEGSKECSDFPDINELPTITAKELSNLIIKLSGESHLGRFYLRAVVIQGRFSLEGFADPNGNNLPSMQFIQCLFTEGACFASTKLSSLSLRGCRFGVDNDNDFTDTRERLHHINIRYAEISGTLDLSHIRPVLMPCKEDVETYLNSAEQKKREEIQDSGIKIKNADYITANISGSNIKGILSASHSTFIEYEDFVLKKQANTTLDFSAFTISNCIFSKSVHLAPGFNAVGGIKSKNIQCFGEFWLAGSTILSRYLSYKKEKSRTTKKANQPNAIDFQSSNFHKNLYLSMNDYKSTIQGSVFLMASKAKDIFIEDVNFLQWSSISAKTLYCKNFHLSNRKKTDSRNITFKRDTKDEENISFIGFSKSICDKVLIDLENHKLYQYPPSKGKDLDFFHAKINNLDIHLSKFYKGDFRHLESSTATIKSNSKTFYLTESIIRKKISIIGKHQEIRLDQAVIGNLDIKNWGTPKLTKKKSTEEPYKWPTLNLSRTTVKGTIDVGRGFAPDQIGTIKKYPLQCFDKKISLVTVLTREDKKSRWSENTGSGFKTGLCAALVDSDGTDIINLTGESSTFSETAKKLDGIYFDNEEKAIEYLCLFCAFLWGQDENKAPNPFRILTSNEIEIIANDDKASKEHIDKEILHPKLKLEIYKNKNNESDENKKYQYFQTIGKLKAYKSIESAINHHKKMDIIIPGNWNKEKNKFDEMKFSKWLESIEKENTKEESWYIPATYFFNKTVSIALFKITKNNPIVEMIDSTIIFNSTNSIEKNNLFYNEYKSNEVHDRENKKSSPEEEEEKHPYLYLPIKDYAGFVQRGADKPAIIELDDGSKSDPSKKYAGHEALFQSILNEEKDLDYHGDLAKRILVGERAALVDLSDCYCELLADGSGHGWGDFIFFKTDRFKPNSLRRYSDFEDGSSTNNESRKKYGNIIEKTKSNFSTYRKNLNRKKIKMKEITKEIDLSPNETYEKGIGNSAISFYHPKFDFKEKRLVWLSRYHDNFDNTKKGAKGIDRDSFRKIAKNYRSIGLEDAAKYIDEARVYREQKEFRKNIMKWDLSLNIKKLLTLIAIAFVLFAIARIKTSTLGQIGVAVTLVILIFWDTIFSYFTKILIRVLFKLWDIIYRLTFRYGLSLRRPLCTIFGFIFLGSLAAQHLDENHFLTIETIAVSQYINGSQTSNNRSLFMPFANTKRQAKVTNIRCGNTVDYGLYAVDVFIPLIELDQAERCLIRPFDINIDEPYSSIIKQAWYKGSAPSNNCKNGKIEWCDIQYPFSVIIKNPTTWRILQASYIVLGWIILSATLLVFSGHLRRMTGGEN